MKRANISKQIKGLKSAVIAYSGGVDSTLLLSLAVKLLGRKKVLAVVARSETYPEREIKAAVAFCKKNRIRYKLIKTDEILDPNFSANPRERCYFCKKELFSKLLEIAKKENLNCVCDGSNLDDLSDFRPGSKAKKELGIKSPLQEAGLTKEQIRRLSKKLKLPTWDKPSLACLSSRIPYGTAITEPLLAQIGRAEEYLNRLGFRQFRVRHHGEVARIEVEEKDLAKLLKFRHKISKKLQELGYKYATLDLLGYRTGSMNL